MRFKSRNTHVIDFIFPISLFFVFAASSLAVLILAANLYNKTVSQTESNDQTRTALSYITEKIRQTDAQGNIRIEQIEGTDCLALSGDYGGTACVTYIYEYDGSLKEFFIVQGIDISLKNGADIIPVKDLTMEEAGERLYRFSCRDKDGGTITTLASERSVQ